MARMSLPQMDEAFIFSRHLAVARLWHVELMHLDPAITGEQYTAHFHWDTFCHGLWISPR